MVSNDQKFASLSHHGLKILANPTRCEAQLGGSSQLDGSLTPLMNISLQWIKSDRRLHRLASNEI